MNIYFFSYIIDGDPPGERMNNNDVLKRLRYALNITDLKVVELFKLVEYDIPKPELESIFKTEGEEGYVECGDALIARFLDALVISRRGRRDETSREAPRNGPRLNNNDILKRIRIALELKDDDIALIMRSAGVEISKSELSALFRKQGHPNFRPCGDQFLRNFLVGLTAKYRV
jgi:uncharacterized protein YehS (DUF1456 family)